MAERVNRTDGCRSARSPTGRRAIACWFANAAIIGLTASTSAWSAGSFDEAAAARLPALRVATSGDYAPFSVFGEGTDPALRVRGFDAAVARAYASDRDLRIEWVRFRWPDLLADLQSQKFDVAMSGITVRRERSLAGIFTTPVATSGAVVLVRRAAGRTTPEALDHSGVRLAVNAGGHLERVARARFPRAQLRTIQDNRAVRDELIAGRVDAVVTDTLEAPGWLEGTSDLIVIGPLTSDRKAYLAATTKPDLIRDLDTWLFAREADGTLARLRARHLGVGAGRPVATPLIALLTAIEERLDLMPLVAEAKRRAGLAVEAPEREARVLEAALARSRDAARTLKRLEPPAARVRALFEAQIEAAKAIQRTTLASPPRAGGGAYDLTSELRPALIRLGDRIASYLVRLPETPEREIHELVREALIARGLAERNAAAIAAAVAQLSPAPREARLQPPQAGAAQ